MLCSVSVCVEYCSLNLFVVVLVSSNYANFALVLLQLLNFFFFAVVWHVDYGAFISLISSCQN